MMKRDFIRVVFLFAVFSLSAPAFHQVQGQKQLQGIDSLSFEVILTGEMLSDSDLKNRFISSMEITPERLILLSTSDQYYLLGWGGMVPLGKRMTRAIQSFAYTPDGLLLTVRGDELCSFDSLGNLSIMFRLPRQGMGISAGQDVIYLFDRNPGQKQYPLYVLARGGKYLKLLETPDPIASVAETDEAVLFAAGPSLYSVDPLTKELRLLFTEENDKDILSVTYDRSNKIAYFSTADRIFAARDADLGVVSEKTGGIIKYYNGLIVFDPASRLVIRILGLEKALEAKPQTEKTGAPVAAAATLTAAAIITDPATTPTSSALTDPPATQPSATLNDPPASQASCSSPGCRHPQAGDIAAVKVLTNESIVDLVRNELSDNIIINLLRRAKVDFILTTDAVIELSGNGVSPEVIMEMRQAMKRQTSETEK